MKTIDRELLKGARAGLSNLLERLAIELACDGVKFLSGATPDEPPLLEALMDEIGSAFCAFDHVLHMTEETTNGQET